MRLRLQPKSPLPPARRRGPANAGRRARPAAFTLFEVVIGLLVLSLFVGSIFTIIQTTLRATVEVESLQREHDRQRQIVDLMRETFGALPPGTSLALRIVEAGEPPVQELEIRGAPNVLPFGSGGGSVNPTTIGLQPTGQVDRETGNPLYQLSVTRSDLLGDDQDGVAQAGSHRPGSPLSLDEQGRNWLPVMRDVRGLQWTFYRADRRQWSDTWRRNTLPDLIKMELWMAGRSHPLTGVFTIPRPGDAAAVPDDEAELDFGSATPVDPATGQPVTPADGPAVPAQVPEESMVQPGGDGGGRGQDQGRGGDDEDSGAGFQRGR